MSRDHVFNFAAGPSVLPESVLKKAQRELLDYRGSGMSVMEMSHRSKLFQSIFDEAKARLKALMAVPDSHEILLLQGGATTQFAAIPINLLEGGAADYAVTGHFSNRAADEARKYGEVRLSCDTSDTNHDRIPTQSELKLSTDARYFYYCANNTTAGTEWHYVPETTAPLVCDMSSDILSCPVDVSRFGLIYAGAQKNMAPAGLTVVILDKSLVGREPKWTPTMLSYQTMVKYDSMLNTPPCWNIYLFSLVLEWVQEQGGIQAMEQLRQERAGMLYELLDESRFYTPHARRDSRSFMNVTFHTPSKELDAAFIAEAGERGLLNVKGYKTQGGLRVSLYNAMPVEGAVAIRDFMKEFEVVHHV